MEILKLKMEKMLAANLITVLLLICNYTTCASQSYKVITNESYKVIKYKSKSGRTYINLNTFEFEDKFRKFPAAYQINNIIFNPDGAGSLILNVLEGKFTIRAGAVSKRWTKMNDLKVAKGDSIYTEFYLRDDPERFHD